VGQLTIDNYKKQEKFLINNHNMKQIIVRQPDYMGKNRKGFEKLCTLFVMLAGLLMLGLASDSWAASGISIASVAPVGTAIVGQTPTTTNVAAASPDLQRDAVLKRIVQTHPSSFPLDTLLSHMPVQDTKSWRYTAYDTPYLSYRGTIAAELSAISSGANTTPFTLKPSNLEHIRKWSCLFFPTIKGSATTDGLPLAAYVVSVARGSSSTMDVIALNAAGGALAKIVVDTPYIIGPIAAHELVMQVEPQVPVPQNYENYNQLFMCQMEVGDYEEAHLKEVGWGWSDIQDYTIMDFRIRRTISYYYGFAKKFVDGVENVEKYSTGGIYRQITRKYPTIAGPWTDSNFVDFSKYVFVGVKGSRRKIVFAGDAMIANMSKAAFIQKQLQAASTEVAFGLTFTKIKTNFGDLLVHYEPLFTEMNISNQALVLDPEFIVRTNFNGISHDKIDAKGAGFKRAKVESVAEASSALLRNRDSHVWVE
jgi:hypothetical protein